MKEEFQEIYDLWKLQEKNYDYNVYTSIIRDNIDNAKNVEELITALDTTKYAYSYKVNLKEIFAQIATDYPETRERIDKISFKREIAKIISPDYYGDRNDVNEIQELDDVDKIIDVLSKMDSRNKTKALAYIKEQRLDKAEKIDLILPKLLVKQHIYNDFQAKDKINSFEDIIYQSQNLDEIISHIVKEGTSIKSFNIFEALQSIQNYYPEKTDTIQEIVNNFTKAESYENLSDFYSNVFKMMDIHPERNQEYIGLIREQLNSDKNNTESLEVIYDKLQKVRYSALYLR
ncbi:MAG: hypothetical protein IJ532_02835 [Alphaproteobacteria bacterium]|nr:hypothetical protein [Alphaproteobacteria bacterium]